MPRRRLSVVVATGALALAALAGCQVEPGTAAYVGNTTYTKADVDKILAQAERDSSKLDPRQEQGVRQQISLFQVFVDVATRFAGEQHYGSPALDPASVAQQIGLPESDPYVQLLTKVDAYKTLLLNNAKPVQPTDAQVREVYRYLIGKGVTKASYEELAPQLLQIQGFAQALEVRRELADAVRRYNVRLNPLYDPDFLLLSVQSQQGSDIAVVVVSLAGGNGAPAVRDLS